MGNGMLVHKHSLRVSEICGMGSLALNRQMRERRKVSLNAGSLAFKGGATHKGMLFLMRLILIFLLLAFPSAAITVSYELSPEIVLPNGYADCTIIITNNELSPVKINSISFYSSTVEVFPSSVAVGVIGPGSSYTLKVSMRSESVGRNVVEMLVSSENFSISQPIELIVDDRFPQIAVSSPLYLGEVNELKLLISSPVVLKDLRIEALFNATPRIAYVGVLSGIAQVSFKFYGDSEDLRFRICFYNGRSYHELERSLKVTYLPSKGISTNIQISRNVLYHGEAAEISIEIANLRNDGIFQIEVQPHGKGKFYPEKGKFEKLESGEKRALKFLFSPEESGEVFFQIKYRDCFGKENEIFEKTSFSVLESEVLKFSNIRKETDYGKIRISGEVVNYGHRKAINVLVSAFCNESRVDDFIGEVGANDYETFDLEIGCVEFLKLSWWNEAGESFSVVEKIKDYRPESKGDMLPYYVSIVSAAAVLLLVVFILLRYLKR
jgi:hypothetical protein